MAKTRIIHWLAPTTMTAALICGASLALGHHLFYSHLAGSPTPTGSRHIVGRSLSEQQLNIAIGTLFATLVKAALILAASIAYIQVFWRSVKNNARSATLAELDGTFSALGNLVSLMDLRNWWRHPLLLLLAVVVWCVPIASIVTPATLSVANARQDPAPTRMMEVPQLDFNSLNFVADMTGPGAFDNVAVYDYTGQSQAVQKVVTDTLTEGRVLPLMSVSFTNASWTQESWGPALQCDDVQGSDRNDIWASVWNSYNDTPATAGAAVQMQAGEATQMQGAYPYLSWVPWSPSFNYTSGGLVASSGLPFRMRELSASSLTLGDPAAIYVAVMPGPGIFQLHLDGGGGFSVYSGLDKIVCTYTSLGPADDVQSPQRCIHSWNDAAVFLKISRFFDDATLLRCNLVNASYSTTWTYVDGVETVKVATAQQDQSPAITPLPKLTTCVLDETAEGSKKLVPNCTDDSDPGPLRTLSYQAISSAFNQRIQGLVEGGQELGISSTGTNVMQTVIAQAEELVSLQAMLSNNSGISGPSWQSLVSSASDPEYLGLVANTVNNTRGSLKSVLEEAFQNVTISMLSEPSLLPNYTSPFAPPRLTNVTFDTYHNIYVYDAPTLWLAYGLAILSTLSAVITGLVTMMLSGAAYDNSFSTIFRVSRTAGTDREVEGDEGAGRQPLPRELAKARIAFDAAVPGVAVEEEGEKRVQSAEARSLLTASESSAGG